MNWRNWINRTKPAPRGLDAEMDDELAFHLEMKQREFEREGLTSEQALIAARRALGNLTLIHEDARAAWRFTWLADLMQDLRHGVRTLAANPGFALTAIVALTVGIGVSGILFTAYNAIALAPWAVREPASLAQVFAERGRAGRWQGLPWPEFRHIREGNQSASDMAAWDTEGLRISYGEATWKATAVAATENFFDMLGTGFVHGRGFSPGAGDLQHPAPELVLQYDAWRSRFGGDPDIVGRWLTVNGHSLRIVGIAAPGFAGPSPAVPDLWLPAPWHDIFHPGEGAMMQSVNSCCAQVMARLKPGASRASAASEFTALALHLPRTRKDEPHRFLLTRPSFLVEASGAKEMKSGFAVVFGVTGLILLLASANVANLLLARGAARRREVAVRLSLGAGPGRIVRQFLAESLVLSTAAAALTVAAANTVPGLVFQWLVGDERLSFTFVTDWRVLASIIGATFVTTMLFSMAPAVATIGAGLAAAGLRDSGGRITRSAGRLRFSLLTAQVAICAALVSGTSLLLRALEQARGIDPGFRYENVLVLSPNLDSSGIHDEDASEPLARLRDRLRALPGIESVALASVVPLGNRFAGTSVKLPGSAANHQTGVSEVSAGFFETLGIVPFAGRAFTTFDETREGSAVVNQALADRLWPGESPIGKSFEVSRKIWVVVGVVRTIYTRGLSADGGPQIYLPSAGSMDARVLVRYSGDPTRFVADLPKVARQVDKRFFPQSERYADYVHRARRYAEQAAAIGGVLSGIAITLALVGIYAVAAFYVAERTREFGVRMALGARRFQILRLVIAQHLRPVLLGSVFGCAGAIALGRVISNLLYGVSPADGRALTWTVVTLCAVAALAMFAPVRRATSVDPAEALRHE